MPSRKRGQVKIPRPLRSGDAVDLRRSSFNLEYRSPATAWRCNRIDVIEKRPGGRTVSMFASSTSPLRWPSRIVLSGVAVFVLGQVVLRVLRRAVPGPMPSRLAPVLTTPLRARLFGTPERVLDRAGVTPGMRILEVGPGPGVYTIPLAQRVASSSEDGGVTCLEIQPEMITMLRE